jgi:hypothetical protein
LLKRDTLQDEVEDAIEAGMKALQEVNENSKIIKDKNNDNNISELPSTSKANGTEILEENSSDSDIDMDDLLSSKTFAKRESKLNK